MPGEINVISHLYAQFRMHFTALFFNADFFQSIFLKYRVALLQLLSKVVTLEEEKEKKIIALVLLSTRVKIHGRPRAAFAASRELGARHYRVS